MFRDTADSFKRIRDTFENTEWNFRDTWIQSFLDFGDTCSKCYMILGILFQIFSGIQDIWPLNLNRKN